MPKVVYDRLNHHALAPTAMCLQLADQTVRYPAVIAENILVKIQNLFIPVDFVDAAHPGQAVLEHSKHPH